MCVDDVNYYYSVREGDRSFKLQRNWKKQKHERKEKDILCLQVLGVWVITGPNCRQEIEGKPNPRLLPTLLASPSQPSLSNHRRLYTST